MYLHRLVGSNAKFADTSYGLLLFQDHEGQWHGVESKKDGHPDNTDSAFRALRAQATEERPLYWCRRWGEYSQVERMAGDRDFRIVGQPNELDSLLMSVIEGIEVLRPHFEDSCGTLYSNRRTFLMLEADITGEEADAQILAEKIDASLGLTEDEEKGGEQ